MNEFGTASFRIKRGKIQYAWHNVTPGQEPGPHRVIVMPTGRQRAALLASKERAA